MIGFFGPHYAHSDAVSLRDDRVCKRVPAELTAKQAEVARLAGRLGRRSGLFRVPRVLRADADAGLIEFERIDGLLTLGQVIERTGDALDLIGRSGRALAGVHEHLELPGELRKPALFAVEGAGRSVSIHGDFNTVNVCHRAEDDAVFIFDWACAEPFGPGSTVGARYLDVCLMLRSLVVHQADLPRAMRNFQPRASAFLEGYQEQWQRRLNPRTLGRALLRVGSTLLRARGTSKTFWKRWVYSLAELAGHLTFRRAADRWRRESSLTYSRRSELPYRATA